VIHVVRMCTYFVCISKMGDIIDQKYYLIRTFAHCTYPVRMYVCVRIVSICTYLHVSIFMRNTYIYYHIRAIRTSKDIHTYTYIYVHLLTYTYNTDIYIHTFKYIQYIQIRTYTNNTYIY
jgi:hypothetical protein